MTTFHDVATYLGSATETEINAAFALCKQRSRELRTVAAAENIATLSPGDTVILKGISPKYLCGATATVITPYGRKQGRVSVKLDQTRGRFSGMATLEVPASCLTKA